MDPRETEQLLHEAEARIDTAVSQLILAAKGVTDAATSQDTALAELMAARKAITAVRSRLKAPA
jgi:hypothetical protein